MLFSVPVLLLPFFNVHLGTSFVDKDGITRETLLQATRLLNRREWITGPPRIVVGEFNEWTRGVKRSRLMESFLKR